MPLDPSIYQQMQPNLASQLAGSLNQFTEQRARLSDLAQQREFQQSQMSRQGQLQDYQIRGLQREEAAYPAKQAAELASAQQKAQQQGSIEVSNIIRSGMPREQAEPLITQVYKKYNIPTDNLAQKLTGIYAQPTEQAANILEEQAFPAEAAKQRFEQRFAAQKQRAPSDLSTLITEQESATGRKLTASEINELYKSAIQLKTTKPDKTLVQVQLPTGETIYQPRAAAAGMAVPQKAPSAPKQDIVKDAVESNALLNQVEAAGALATGSGLGTARDISAGFFGVSTEGAKAAAKLKVLGASLTAKVPKMGGPQSDKDVAMYKEAAGNIADPKTPWETKQAAIETIREINNRQLGYAQGQKPAQAGGLKFLGFE